MKKNNFFVVKSYFREGINEHPVYSTVQ